MMTTYLSWPVLLPHVAILASGFNAQESTS